LRGTPNNLFRGLPMKRCGLESLLIVVCVAGSFAAACGTSSSPSTFELAGDNDAGLDVTTVSNDDGGEIFLLDDASLAPSTSPLVMAPLNEIVDVVAGQPSPVTQYSATLDGVSVAASWRIDRGEIGSISAAGAFTPKGVVGGKATITASYRGKEVSTAVTVRVRVTQNGATSQTSDAGGGSGGAGGVGGEGSGGPIDAGKQTVLRGKPVAQAGLGVLYPYDGTVWPRGILAPLLQWTTGPRSYDAVSIEISEAAFSYQGFFAKPSKSGSFQRHPIPQEIWRQLALSNAGEDVTVTITLSEGAVAYGPITQKWKIASAPLKGTVYYNSYGTALAKNHGGGLGGFARFGGATLAIRGNSTDPTLVAGADGDGSKCRVCHSVAANGSVLITQHGNAYSRSSTYKLASPTTETVLKPDDGRFAWAAISPNGAMLFSNAGPISGGTTELSGLFALPTGTAVASKGLPAGLKAAMPVFSPDGKHVAFNFYGGTGADERSLAVLDFDPTTKSFANLRKIYTPASANVVAWPTFFPTNNAVAFHVQTRSNGRDFGGTRSDCDDSGVCSNSGARAELWWSDLAATPTAHRLDKLNGIGLPKGGTAHDDDATLNYEPTLNPVPSGGYAWIVFMSRRLYGNVATINPFWSDPRYHDISVTPTTKKLWVAAIDLNAPPGTDPSHPAFYLPAQELLAGNSRGYWVVDPCEPSGTSCTSARTKRPCVRGSSKSARSTRTAAPIRRTFAV
jgi:hypothetical protein